MLIQNPNLLITFLFHPKITVYFVFCCHLLAVTLHNNQKMYPACISAIVYLTLFASIRLQYILCYNNQNIFPIDLYFSSAVGVALCVSFALCSLYNRSDFWEVRVSVSNGTCSQWHK